MTPEEIGAAATYHLAFYVEGKRNSCIAAPAPGEAEWHGIFLRCPALLSSTIECEGAQDASPFDCQRFEANDGPEPCSEPYIFVDMCPMVRVRVQQTGTVLDVSFDCIVDFPAEAFPVELPIAKQDLAGRRVVLPSSMGEPALIAAECLTRMQECLGADSSQLTIQHDVVVMRYEDYDGTLV